jgi:hypothetical protein
MTYKYETTSLWNASALYSLGLSCKAEIIGTLPDGRNRFIYIFTPETEEEETQLKIRVDKINREELNVNLKLLEKSWQTLKNLKS